MDVEALRTKYRLGKDSRDWSIDRAKSDVLVHASFDTYAKRILMRCFDTRWVFYPGTSKGFVGTPAYPIMQHMLHDNIAFCLIRNSRGRDAVLPFVAKGLVCKDAVSSLDNCRVFPLYLYNDNMGQMEKAANLDKEIWAKINAAVGFDTTPEDVFNYIYAVLHTPEYRERYKEFLKVDFPRIPYPKNGDVFRKLAEIGRQIVSVHLLKDSATGNMFDPRAQFPAAGSNRVDLLKYEGGKVKINAGQYFDNVPEAAWNFFIGGYQPAQKWLKDRKGRTLNADDIMHYKAIVIALMETSRLMAELSALSSDWI